MAAAAAPPERPRPSTAMTLPARPGMRIASFTRTSPQFQGGKADQRQHRGDDPEADHHGWLRPALLFVMVMQRRHAEDALAGQFERGNLHDDRNGLDDEETAD